MTHRDLLMNCVQEFCTDNNITPSIIKHDRKRIERYIYNAMLDPVNSDERINNDHDLLADVVSDFLDSAECEYWNDYTNIFVEGVLL